MSLWTSQEIRDAVSGTGGALDAEIDQVVIDSRAVRPGSLFVAIAGERMDGHKFVGPAFEAGAAEALVHQAELGGIICGDTFKALENLARASVARAATQRIAVTGSVGKTGTKELLAVAFDAYATKGNLNNHYGLPLTLANMPRDCGAAILELGMNHSGEIRALTAIAQPEIAIITAIAAAHSEFFADETEIADAKAEIFEGLTGPKIAIIPADSIHTPRLRAAAEKYADKIVTFGQGGDATITELLQLSNGRQTIVADVLGEQLTWNLSLFGQHWARNSLAVALALKVAGKDVARGLAKLVEVAPLPGRGQLLALGQGVRVLDEVYNSSPSALKAAIKVAGDLPADRQRVAILGDMLELGETGPQAHRDAIKQCQDAGFTLLLGCGPLFSNAIAQVRQTGKLKCKAYADSAELLEKLGPLVGPDDLILVKGSLGSKMTPIRDELVRRYEP